MTEENGQADQRSLLEKVLGAFTEVRAGEGPTALLLTLNLFVLLSAFYVIKPIRDTLIVNVEGGPEYKSYMGGAIALALLFAVPAYARVASRMPRNRLLVGVSLFFASNLVLFFFLRLLPGAQEGPGRLWFALGFFLWAGVFGMMIVAQAWAFANDVYTDEQGKRLFALVGLGASVGSAVGSLVIAGLIKKLGMTTMFLLGAGLLSLSALLIQVIHRRETAHDVHAAKVQQAAKAPVAPPKAEAKAPEPEGSFALVWKHRYLVLLAAFSMVFTLVNTNGEYILSRLVKDFAKDLAAGGASAKEVEAQVGAFYGSFYSWVNVVGVLLQSFAVSRIIKLGGLRVAFFVLPVIAFADSLGMALMPILMVARIGKIAENAVDYSLNNTVRNMLWLPTTKEMKYRAKQAVDSFFVRMGDVGSALMVFVMGAQLGLGVRAFAVTNLLLVAVWLWLALAIVRENKEMVRRRDLEELRDAEPST